MVARAKKAQTRKPPPGTLPLLVHKGLSLLASMSAAVYLVLALVSCMPEPPHQVPAVPTSDPLSGSSGWAVTTDVRTGLREEPDSAAVTRRFIPRGSVVPVNTESEDRSRLGGCLAPFVSVTHDEEQWWIHGCGIRRFDSQISAERFAGRLPPLPGDGDSP